MADNKYTTDLKASALFLAGENTTGSSAWNSRVLEYLNRGYRAIWMGGAEIDPTMHEAWLWLRKSSPGTLTLSPSYSTGTISVTNNSTSITFSSAPTDDKVGWFFKVDDHGDIFRIVTHGAGNTVATLDSVYTGSTSSAASFKVFKTEYSLASDLLMLFSPMRVYQDNRKKIYGTSSRELDEKFPMTTIVSGVPTAFAFIGDKLIRFNKYGYTTSTELIRIDYDYLYAPSDLTGVANEEPVIPIQWRRILAEYAAGLILYDKNDNRADIHINMAKNMLLSMKLANDFAMVSMTRNFGRISTRKGIADSHILRTESGLIIG